MLRHIDNKTDILLSNTTVFPVKASDQVPTDVASELNKAAPAHGPSTGGPAGNLSGDTNRKEFATAKAFVGTDTRNTPWWHLCVRMGRE